MPKYEATFLVPAQVRITMTVEGDGQEAALANAYDALAAAGVASCVIASLDKDYAELGPFIRLEDAVLEAVQAPAVCPQVAA